MKIFGLMGAKGAGKDYLCEQIAASGKVKVRRFAFGDALKQELVDAFGVSVDIFNDCEKKKIPTPLLTLAACEHPGYLKTIMLACDDFDFVKPRSPRFIMQTWGTEFRRSIDSDYWINPFYAAVQDAIKDDVDFLVITDVRFPNEMDAIEKAGGKLVAVRNDLAERDITEASHISERYWMERAPFMSVHNPYPAQGEMKVILTNDTVIGEENVPANQVGNAIIRRVA